MSNGDQRKKPNAVQRAFPEYFQPKPYKPSNIPRTGPSPFTKPERETTVMGGGELNLLKKKTPLFSRARGGPVSPSKLIKGRGRALSAFAPGPKKSRRARKIKKQIPM
jgi:hypothetical protein